MGTRNRFSVARCCCEEVPPPCVRCEVGTDPGDTLVVAFDGWQDDWGCDCESFFNDLFVLTRRNNDPCVWGVDGFINLYCYFSNPTYYSIQAYTNTDLGNVGWFVTIKIGSWSAYFKWDSGGSDPIDCEANQTLSYVGCYPSPTPWFRPNCANYENVICEVNP